MQKAIQKLSEKIQQPKHIARYYLGYLPAAMLKPSFSTLVGTSQAPKKELTRFARGCYYSTKKVVGGYLDKPSLSRHSL